MCNTLLFMSKETLHIIYIVHEIQQVGVSIKGETWSFWENRCAERSIQV